MVELISRDEHEKLYLQLFEILKKKIENKEWTAGMQIPTEEQLCKMFNVSRATVRNAVLELVRQGYLIRQQGKGTFVNENFVSEGLIMNTVFRKLWVQDDSKFKKYVIAKTVIMPIDDLVNELNISANKHVIYIKSIWATESNPSILQETFVPLNICPQLLEDDLDKNSIVDIFEKKYSIKITKVLSYFDLAILDRELSKSLQIAEGEKVIRVVQKILSGDTVVALNRLFKRNDEEKLFIALHRKAL